MTTWGRDVHVMSTYFVAIGSTTLYGLTGLTNPPYKVTDHLSPGPATCEAED